MFYIITKQITTHKAFVYFKILQHNVKASLCPAFAYFGKDEEKPFDVILSIQNETFSLVAVCSKELVEENHATVKPDSSVTPRGMKTYSESTIEL